MRTIGLLVVASALLGCDLLQPGDDQVDSPESSGGSGGQAGEGGSGAGGIGRAPEPAGEGGSGGDEGGAGDTGGGGGGNEVPLVTLDCYEGAAHVVACVSAACGSAALLEAAFLNECEANKEPQVLPANCEDVNADLEARIGDYCASLASPFIPTLTFVHGVVFGPTDPNGDDWDGDPILNDFIVDTILNLLNVPDPTGVFEDVVTQLVEAVASGFVPPEPEGTAYAWDSVAAEWLEARDLQRTSSDSFDTWFVGPPGWTYGLAQFASIRASLRDVDAFFDDAAGTVEVDEVDLYRAYLKGGVHPVYVGDQSAGVVLYLMIEVVDESAGGPRG